MWLYIVLLWGPTSIEDQVSIGHNAPVHGCEIRDNVTIEINATVLNRAKIGKNSIVGAGAVVTEDKKFPEESLILGLFAKAVRKLAHEEIELNKSNTQLYVELAKNI